jgi:hypothetical protein
MAQKKEEEDSIEQVPLSILSALDEAVDNYYHLIEPETHLASQDIDSCEIVSIIGHDISYKN